MPIGLIIPSTPIYIYIVKCYLSTGGRQTLISQLTNNQSVNFYWSTFSTGWRQLYSKLNLIAPNGARTLYTYIYV
jgi:hypothetical protein